MAKIKRNIQTFSGKIGDLVHVDSTTYGPHTRRPVKPGSKKNEPALKKQHSRTKWLNSIAGAINKVVRKYAPILKPATFYNSVSSLLRKEPDDNRLLLLRQLRGMEINPDYPMHKLGKFTCSSTGTQAQLHVELAVNAHPLRDNLQADCWYYAVILVVWQKGRPVPYDDCQFTEWINIKDEEPVFDLVFKKPANGTQWLLLLQQVLGKNEVRTESLKAEGMVIADAGSFDKKDLQLLKKRMGEEKNAAAKPVKKAARKEIVRVKRRK